MLLVIFLMDGARTEQRNRVVLVRLSRGKVSARIPKAIFSYIENLPLIKLT